MASRSPYRRDTEIESAPRLSWATFFEWFKATWLDDEHVTVIGPTGAGKSVLVKEILRIRRRVVTVWNKPKDPLIQQYQRDGYTLLSRWPRNPPDDLNRAILWVPRPRNPDAQLAERRAFQREILGECLHRIYSGPRGGEPGGWCVNLNEARYVADMKFLGLGPQVIEIEIQGRTIQLPLVLEFQRPSWVPPEAYDQASFLFIAADNDRKNIQRFREIGGADGEELAATVSQLGRYEFAFVDARPGCAGIAIVKVEKPRSAARRPRAGTVRA